MRNSLKPQENKTKIKEIVLLNSANEAATSLVALANKTSDCNYLILTMEEMLANMKQQMMDKKKGDAKDSSEEEFSSDPESE